ncbi:MAG: hypothetical protein LUG51_03555 [Tannerellaceae bacterium]|nr:hypothetical protein [Tannerellaceae bacterium]
MSFAGHVYDMIRRDKENRELRKQLRKRNEPRETYLKGDACKEEPRMTLEEWEEINRRSKERKGKEQQARLWVVVGIVVAFALALGIIAFIF